MLLGKRCKYLQPLHGKSVQKIRESCYAMLSLRFRLINVIVFLIASCVKDKRLLIAKQILGNLKKLDSITIALQRLFLNHFQKPC